MRNDIDLEYFEARLRERLEAIEAAAERQKKDGAPVELDQSKVGRLSRMDALQQQAMSQASARASELERGRIKSALSRMAADEYGYCIKCEEEIAEERLRFDPSVLTCIECARAADGGR